MIGGEFGRWRVGVDREISKGDVGVCRCCSHHGIEELASGHDLRTGPCGGKMPGIASDQIMRRGCLRTLQENVVVRV